MVAVAYRKWSFTRGFNCEALAGKILVFWIGGRLWETIAYERWSHMDVLTVFWWYTNFLENFVFDPKPLSGADSAPVLF